MGIGIISSIILIVLGYIFIIVSYFVKGTAKNVLFIIGILFILAGIIILYYMYYKKNNELKNKYE